MSYLVKDNYHAAFLMLDISLDLRFSNNPGLNPNDYRIKTTVRGRWFYGKSAGQLEMLSQHLAVNCVWKDLNFVYSDIENGWEYISKVLLLLLCGKQSVFTYVLKCQGK